MFLNGGSRLFPTPREADILTLFKGHQAAFGQERNFTAGGCVCQRKLIQGRKRRGVGLMLSVFSVKSCWFCKSLLEANISRQAKKAAENLKICSNKPLSPA